MFLNPNNFFQFDEKPLGTSKKSNLLPKLFGPIVRKNCFSDQENFLKFEAEGQEFGKFTAITITIYSNSERPEQFLATESFSTCSWIFIKSDKSEQLEFKLQKLL